VPALKTTVLGFRAPALCACRCVSVAIAGAARGRRGGASHRRSMSAASAAHPHWVSSPKANKRHGVLLAGPAATFAPLGARHS